MSQYYITFEKKFVTKLMRTIPVIQRPSEPTENRCSFNFSSDSNFRDREPLPAKDNHDDEDGCSAGAASSR